MGPAVFIRCEKYGISQNSHRYRWAAFELHLIRWVYILASKNSPISKCIEIPQLKISSKCHIIIQVVIKPRKRICISLPRSFVHISRVWVVNQDGISGASFRTDFYCSMKYNSPSPKLVKLDSHGKNGFWPLFLYVIKKVYENT